MSISSVLSFRDPSVISAFAFALVAFFMILGAVDVSAKAGNGFVTVGDLLRMRTITEVVVAPDGSYAIYVVKSIHEKRDNKKNGKGEYEYRTHLWRININDDKAQPIELTFGARTASDPAISSDGKWLAFTRQEEVDDPKTKRKSQVWLMPMNHAGEAHPVTDLEEGASHPVWHPTENKILVTSHIPFSKIEGLPDWDTEQPGLSQDELQHLKSTNHNDDAQKKNEQSISSDNITNTPPDHNVPDNDLESVREWLYKNANDSEKANPNIVTRRSFLEEHDLAGEMKSAHLFMINLDDYNETGTCTSQQLTSGFHSYNDSQFSPDGSLISFTDKPREGKHPDRYFRSCIYIMNADGSNIHKIAGDESRTFSQARFLPDGKTMITTTVPTEEMWYQQEEVARMNLDGSGFHILTQDWPSNAGQVRISKGDGHIFFTTSWQGTYPLRAIDIDAEQNGSTREIEISENAGVEAFDVQNNTIVAAVTSVNHPMRLITMDGGGYNPRLLHDLNPWVSDITISIPEEHWITRPDGTRVEYWVMAPMKNHDAIKVPTVLEIHGGPSAMWGPGESTMWLEYQLLCAWGYGVVYSNPRGSGGYGYEFQRANHQNWGEGPTGDVLAALDDAAAHYSWIDSEQYFVTGGSYAGYLTAWIVSHDNRFKAAVAQRGVYDLNTFFGEGNAWILVPWAMGGYPWDDATQEILQKESPFTYVNQIHTPLMIIHSSQDLRTGVSQSEMMYRALKELNREVEYVRYPDAGHDLSRTGDPKQRMDRILRIIEFFERYR